MALQTLEMGDYYPICNHGNKFFQINQESRTTNPTAVNQDFEMTTGKLERIINVFSTSTIKELLVIFENYDTDDEGVKISNIEDPPIKSHPAFLLTNYYCGNTLKT
jgi:hypothetical protein